MQKIKLNIEAIKTMISVVEDAVADTDYKFALEYINNIQSALNGLKAMIEKN
jgi:hypothetical protein